MSPVFQKGNSRHMRSPAESHENSCSLPMQRECSFPSHGLAAVGLAEDQEGINEGSERVCYYLLCVALTSVYKALVFPDCV